MLSARKSLTGFSGGVLVIRGDMPLVRRPALVGLLDEQQRSGVAATIATAELDEPARRLIVDSFRLAYVSEAPVNWCPGLGTVLANEEVTSDGRSERGNFPSSSAA